MPNEQLTDVANKQPSYCPACFALIDAGEPQCPVCGQDIARLSARDYRDKLLAALHHPIADIRLRAIIALGLRADEQAADTLVACALSHPADIIEGFAIIDSLERIHMLSIRRQALTTLAEQHAAHAVRAAAQQALSRR